MLSCIPDGSRQGDVSITIRPMRLALVLFFLCCVPAHAADKELGAVVVTAQRNPVDKSYRKMIRGMDLFEEKHALAPRAALRYRVLPRNRATKMQDVELTVAGDTVTLPIDLEPDGTFTLERDAKALAEDASVQSNRRAGTMTWRTEIRSPGVPPGARRLGDLRLECEVGMEADLVSDVRSLFSNPTLRWMGFCSSRTSGYLFFTERPLFGVTLVAGARRETLPVDDLYGGSTRHPLSAEELRRCDCEVLLDRSYFLPLGDKSWPDDTLVEFEYMYEGASLGKAKEELLALLGEGNAVRFESGYEVRVYRPGDGSEFVALISPTGTLLKTRTLNATPEATTARGPARSSG